MTDTVTKTFTPLHYTCRHVTSSHLNFTQLHFTTLSFGLTPFKFPTASFTSASNRNEYQEYFRGGGGKGGQCVGLTTLSPSCADCLEMWEPQPPGTLGACPGLYSTAVPCLSRSVQYCCTVPVQICTALLYRAWQGLYSIAVPCPLQWKCIIQSHLKMHTHRAVWKNDEKETWSWFISRSFTAE
jgi:hypothetical protein